MSFWTWSHFGLDNVEGYHFGITSYFFKVQITNQSYHIFLFSSMWCFFILYVKFCDIGAFCFCSECCSFQHTNHENFSEFPCLQFSYCDPNPNSLPLEKAIHVLAEAICPILLDTIIKGSRYPLSVFFFFSFSLVFHVENQIW